jgi:hypothetical protein
MLRDTDPVQIDFKTYKRFVAAVRWVESQTASPKSVSRMATPLYLVRALSTEPTGTGSFASPGVGEARIHHLDSAGDWAESSGPPVAIYNQFSGDIPANTAMILGWISGRWFVIAAACVPEPA